MTDGAVIAFCSFAGGINHSGVVRIRSTVWAVYSKGLNRLF